MSGCTTSDVGAATPLGIVIVGLPSAASVTVGRPSTGATASPVARASGVRTLLTSMTNSSVSFFLTFVDVEPLGQPVLRRDREQHATADRLAGEAR